MTELIVLLEKNFKNILRSRPKTLVSSNITLPLVLTNRCQTEVKKEYKPLIDFWEGLNRENNVVEILPEDIIDSESDHDVEDSLCYDVKIKRDTQLNNNSDMDETNSDEFTAATEDSSCSTDNKNIEICQRKSLVEENTESQKIKHDSDIKLEFQEMEDTLNYLSPNSESNESNKRKMINNSTINSKNMKVKRENQSDGEYKPDEDSAFENSDENVSDWEAERSSPNKKINKEKLIKNEGDYEPNRKELMDKSPYFICETCRVEVRSRAEKDAHRKSHNLRYLKFKMVFRCPKCAREVVSRTKLKLHYQKHHSMKALLNEWKKCKGCAYKTLSRQSFKKHVDHHKNKGAFQCEYCTFSHDSKRHLTIHSQVHDAFLTRILRCEECSYITTHYDRLVRHRKSNHIAEEQKKWNRCKECPFKTIELNNLRKHMRCHQLEDGYQCPHCTYRSPYACRIKDHIKIHYGKDEPIPDYNPKLQKPLHSCTRCPYTTMTKAHLDRHMTSHKTADNRRIGCAECPFTCKDKIDLATHVKGHNGEGELKCPWCSFTHTHSFMMTKHKHLHNKKEREKKLLKEKYRKGEPRCPICKELFQAQSFVKRHMSKHQTIDQVENPFMCALCPYRCKFKDVSFINHIQCHFRTDGIKCDFCSYRHDRQNVMTMHMRLHKETNIKTEMES